ncbi:hypothetical protein KPL47_22270 [Clostridium estertheticum]|uniref:hypothetical protein n=1 Tax=Clostridium estertheticum TaxID=238834 RepID=UPI001C0B2307|nr:hypothetical protein [Clostridium estertheticum]MBU3179024.1 hypothetical protein [Clostridium estertheticum]
MEKHLNELQVYSGIAILFVTLIHSNAFYLSSFLQLDSYTDAGLILNLLDKVVHVAVPIFLFHEPLFISKLSRILIKYNLYNSILMIPIVAIISILLSICFYRGLIKIKIGKYIFNKPNLYRHLRLI